MPKIFSIRLWILITALVLSLFAISPNPTASGIEIKSVQPGSLEEQNGITEGEILLSINGNPIGTLSDYNEIVKELENNLIGVNVKTDKGEFSYEVIGDIGFNVRNLTVVSSDNSPLEHGLVIEEINNFKVNNDSDFNEITKELFPKKILKIETSKGNYAYLTTRPPEISVKVADTSNIRKGLELEGGTRVLLKPISDREITQKNIMDLMDVMSNRLNVYGLSDVKIRSANDLAGDKFILVELAGVSKGEVEDLIAQQGVFEAKIANNTVFIGGNRDVPYVCKDDGSCSGIRDCTQSAGTNYCRFEFVITISPQAAQRHAEITKDLDVVTEASGRRILNDTIDFYLDGKEVDSLQISESLKGSASTSILISGPGVGTTRNAAIDDAVNNMNQLQTILITGSLPLDIEVVKLDSISPFLGRSFINNAFLVAALAILSVAIVIYIRYRSFKIIIPMIITQVSEIVIILGFAAFIQWNLDLASIAGIIAAVGTGVDDQIVIADEVLKGESERFFNWRQKIKRAFFIILASYFTTVAAMIPLWNAGAGLVRGFAITTIIGVTVGVLITRPAFASMVERFLNK